MANGNDAHAELWPIEAQSRALAVSLSVSRLPNHKSDSEWHSVKACLGVGQICESVIFETPS